LRNLLFFIHKRNFYQSFILQVILEIKTEVKGKVMSILQEIQKWSQHIPFWQQDAIARLYARPHLSADDIEDIYALLKAEHGIPDPKGRIAGKLAADQVAVPQIPDQLVRITAIKNLRNVNAIAEGQKLSIGSSGLTVIYGDNGAGKSGYSRVLKKACRARDQSEPILANAYKNPINSNLAQAAFELLIDEKSIEVEWTSGSVAPAHLSAIAIFDSHCARAYVDNQGDFAYTPYGLDILEGLVKVCTKLRDRGRQEQAANKPNIQTFARLAQMRTTVGRFLASLSANTKSEDVERLGTLSVAESERLITINKTLVEADPKQKANDLKLRANRLSSLSIRIDAAIAAIDEDKIAELRGLIDKAALTKKISDISAKQFQETPGLLQGTGSEAWKILFEAAREFAIESHVGKIFPHLGDESFCPLCQNPLGTAGVDRLAAFDSFIQKEAEKVAKIARDSAKTAYRAIDQAKIDLAIDETLSSDLISISPELAGVCSALQASLRERRTAITKASAPDGDWTLVPKLSADPKFDLVKAKQQLLSIAKTLEESMDMKAKAVMETEQAELESRRQFVEIKSVVLDAIAKFTLNAKLNACIEATGTTAISRKSTDLTKTMATQEVADALNVELQSLCVHDLRIVMKPESPKGKMQFKLVLELPGGGCAADILSEGEQRAIAIASFLAEVRLSKGLGGVIFDDPVSSLDHSRRERVAARLAREAQDRQVIVFTHDIFFLNVLIHNSRELGMEPKCLSLSKTPVGFGVAQESLPFGGCTTKERVGILRQMQVKCVRLHNSGNDYEYKREIRDLYAHLRMAWERGVEELLFNGVVLRFRKGIETNRLNKVIVKEDDVKIIQVNMSKCSNYTGHDGAMEANIATPSPGEALNDVNALDGWRDEMEKRRNKK
jgi:energy-coupling factor transporter ATP-binding protein EcfA2